MLENFFKLNEPWDEFIEDTEIVNHFNISNDLRNVLYRPDFFSPKKPYRLNKKTFKNVSFSKTVIEKVVFRECSFLDCLFIGATFRKCEFHDCTFEGCNPHKISFEDSYIDPNCFKKLLDPHNHTNIGLHLFNQLLQNARKQEQDTFINSAAYLYNKWSRYHLNWKHQKGHVGKLNWILKWTPNYLYDLVAGYGWKIQNFIVSSVVFLFLVSFANYLLWDHLGMVGIDSKNGTNLIVSTYYTIVTLTTLGYGDIFPTTPTGMILASVEAIIGLLWLGILVSIIFRRVFR